MIHHRGNAKKGGEIEHDELNVDSHVIFAPVFETQLSVSLPTLCNAKNNTPPRYAKQDLMIEISACSQSTIRVQEWPKGSLSFQSNT